MLRTVPAVPYNGLTSSFLNGGGMFSFPAGGGGAGSSSDTQVLFNDSGTVAGDTGFTFNKTTNTVSADIFTPAAGFPNGIQYDSTTLIYGNGGQLTLYLNNGNACRFDPTGYKASQVGIYGWTAGTDATQVRDTGVSRISAGLVGIGTGAAAGYDGSLQLRNITQQESSGDVVPVVNVARKSRGTQGSPTAITTGDGLLSVTAQGYVGATNTFIPAAALIFNSTSSVSDSANGIGGVIDVRAQLAGSGTSTLPTILRISGSTKHVTPMGTVPAITADGGTNPSIVGTDHAFTITVGSGGIAQTVTVTFGRPWTNKPQCVANHEGAILAVRCVPTTTTVVIDAAAPFTAGGLIDVICQGYE